MSETTEPWITAPELAVLLGLSTETVYRQAKTGDIPSSRFGRALRFKLSIVEAEKAKQRDPWAYSPQSRAAKRRAS